MDDEFHGTYLDVKSPFGGRVYSNNKKEENLNEKPHQGRICYFDPTSIKLELNPNIFTADEIQNAKVFATCGVRKGVEFGSTDAFHAAQGLAASTVKQDLTSIYWNRLTNGAPYDAMTGYKDADKTGMKAVRLNELKKWLYRTLQPTDGTWLVYYDWFPFKTSREEGHGALFDGCNTTPWRLYEDHKTDQHGNEKEYNSGAYDSKRLTCWTEFQTCYPVKPSSYTIVTGRHGSEAPKEWALMAKTRETDKWILLDYRNGNDLPNKPTTSKEINFNRLQPSAVGA